ncbi:MAG: prepilin-type N-terminal cleavage/methylation domain-containing protein [Myxococcota bacterium]
MRSDLRARRVLGFSLLEMLVALVLLSVLAGATAPLALTHIRNQRLRTTLDRMTRVVVGMAGDPQRASHGYLGDMGALPAVLDDLNARGAAPFYAIDPNDGVGAGYNGPYVVQAGAAGAEFVDAWGTGFGYVAGTAQVTSAGPDRQFGTADDLAMPGDAPVTSGSVTVNLTGVPNDGSPECVLGEDDANVFVSRSVAGTRNELQIAGPVGSGGPFVGTGLHNGLHGLRVTGQGDFAGASVRDVIEVRSGAVQRRVTLIQPTGLPAGC